MVPKANKGIRSPQFPNKDIFPATYPGSAGSTDKAYHWELDWRVYAATASSMRTCMDLLVWKKGHTLPHEKVFLRMQGVDYVNVLRRIAKFSEEEALHFLEALMKDTVIGVEGEFGPFRNDSTIYRFNDETAIKLVTRIRQKYSPPLHEPPKMSSTLAFEAKK